MECYSYPIKSTKIYGFERKICICHKLRHYYDFTVRKFSQHIPANNKFEFDISQDNHYI